MASVADRYDYVVGVDTHARTHTYAVIDATSGRVVDTAVFPTTEAGLSRVLSWIRRRTDGRILAAVEGTGSYGASLTRAFNAVGIDVCDVRPPRRGARAGRGKTDEMDAVHAARNALASTTTLNSPRADGARAALRVLLLARQSMDVRRTADRNALTALLRINTLGVDVRKPITNTQIETIAAWRRRPADTSSDATIRAEARRLARSVLELTQQLLENVTDLTTHISELAPGLLNLRGVGPVTGAIILTAYSHKGRVRSEAAFASLAGVAPLPASSGNTVRHRLSRHGDRQLNRALHVIARVRTASDPETRAYVERRIAEGRTKREIRRSLKRYIARQIFRQLNTLMLDPING